MENNLSEKCLEDLVNNRKYNEVIDICFKNLKTVIDGPEYMYFYLGKALRGVSRINEAMVAFTKAIQKNDKYTDAYYELGMLQGETASLFRRDDINKVLTRDSQIKFSEDGILFTCFDEQYLINDIFSRLPLKETKICVDIGAGDGVTFSNSYFLFKKGWKGMVIEADENQFFNLSHYMKEFKNVDCIRTFVSPENVNKIIGINNIPKDFDFLSLDIDSYDYYVLEKILEEYSPKVICSEINELIPPPIKLAVKYPIENYESLKIVGQSISILYELLKKNGYSIIHLEYNNIFAVKDELLEYVDYPSLTDKEAYIAGLVNRKDWFGRLQWNIEKLNYIWSDKENIHKFLESIDVKNDDRYYLSYN